MRECLTGISRRIELSFPFVGVGKAIRSGPGLRPPTRAIRLSACHAQGVRTEASDTCDIACRLREKYPNWQDEGESLAPTARSIVLAETPAYRVCLFANKESLPGAMYPYGALT